MVASRGPGGRLVVPRQVPAARDNGRAGELGIVYLKRWFVVTAIGLTLLVGLANCVVAPVAPVSPESVSSLLWLVSLPLPLVRCALSHLVRPHSSKASISAFQPSPDLVVGRYSDRATANASAKEPRCPTLVVPTCLKNPSSTSRRSSRSRAGRQSRTTHEKRTASRPSALPQTTGAGGRALGHGFNPAR
jgi:hypothetical protein